MLVTQYEDADGARLEAVLDRERSGAWVTFLRYRRHGRQWDRGATTYHSNEKVARRVFHGLEDEAAATGWKLKVVLLAPREPAKMVLAGDQRLFRDARTGELFADESSSRPPAVPLGGHEPLGGHDSTLFLRLADEIARPHRSAPPARRDAFTLTSLPSPQLASR